MTDLKTILLSIPDEVLHIMISDYVSHIAYSTEINQNLRGYILALKDALNELDNLEFNNAKKPTYH